MREIGYSVVLCKPFDPQTKGRVEQAVRFVKEQFLEGREYCGIDCLNSACLEWLDKSGNAVVSAMTGKTAHELFREEAKSLIKIPYKSNKEKQVVSVGKTNSLRYKKNNYELPIGFKPGDKVEVKELDGRLLVLMPESGEVVCEHGIPNGFGNTVKLKDIEPVESVGYAVMTKRFADNENILNFISQMKSIQPRYYLKGCARLWKMTNYYTDTQLTEAAKYCLQADKPNMAELTAYLIYRHGAETAKNFVYQSLLFNYKQRANEIKEAFNGYNEYSQNGERIELT